MLAVRMLLKTLVISSLCLPLLAFASVGKIEKVGVGASVKISRAGAAIRLKEGDELQPGDELSTDANTAVDIRLEDETLIRVGVNSSYKVEEESQVHTLVHRLLAGVVRVLVKPTDRDHTNPTIKFKMLTPEGTIGVRGTEFVVLRANGNTQLKGLDGEVLFGPLGADFAKADDFVLVQRGFESSIKAGGKRADKPEKFDLRKYLSGINGNGPPFGALSGHPGAAVTRYARNSPAPAPAPLTLPSNHVAVAAAAPEEPKEKKSKEAPRVDYQTMLLKAAIEGDIPSATTALNHGADINGSNKESLGHTALQTAILGNQKEMFLFLITKGANVDREDENGHTPLMIAALHHLDMDMVRALVSPGGANFLTVFKPTGETAAEMAKKEGYPEMANYLNSEEAAEDLSKVIDEKESQGKKPKKARAKATKLRSKEKESEGE